MHARTELHRPSLRVAVTPGHRVGPRTGGGCAPTSAGHRTPPTWPHNHPPQSLPATSTGPAPAATPAAGPASAPFDWAQQWYPVHCATNAPGPGPPAVQLLGRDLVVWRDPASGGWSCLDDACAHRQAPLSEGRVEQDGRLHCAYHGWAFNGAGACTRCPQAESPAALRTVLASPRSAVRSYPVTVAASLVFVFPDADPGAAARAAAAPPPVVPNEVLDAAEKRGWYARDLP